MKFLFLTKVTINRIKEKYKKLKESIKKYEFCKNLVFSCANSKLEPLRIIHGLKFAVQHIKKKKWTLAKRLAGTSGNLEARGICPKCEINLFGKDTEPSVLCDLKNCPFENQMKERRHYENTKQRTSSKMD